MMKRDALIIGISDTHSGSNTALFLDREWHGVKTSHIPRAKQVIIRRHWEAFAEWLKSKRKDKQVILVHDGDAIDGDHHHSGDICTMYENEQAEIHVEIMVDFKKRIGWQRGDELYYVKGTEIHTREIENEIASQMGAVPCGDFGAWDILNLDIHGKKFLFSHHGCAAGSGANEGNSIRNMLRTIRIDAMKEGKRHPDVIYSGHVHQPTYSNYVYRRDGFKFDTMHYVILPSWQMKTRYAYGRVPFAANRIGGVAHEIKADGTITIPEFFVMESE